MVLYNRNCNNQKKAYSPACNSMNLPSQRDDMLLKRFSACFSVPCNFTDTVPLNPLRMLKI